MGRYWTPELAPGVFAVGVKDPNRRLFDSLIPLPQGTTYNAYLVRGSARTALVDTVSPGFESELLARVASICADEPVDYVIMNHAEPDHAGAIPEVLTRYPEATLVTGRQGARMARLYFGASPDRIEIVSEGQEIDLGGKTLRFLETPMLHWPETIMTYVVEEQVLFSCDFFGTHTATGLYASDVPEIIPFAKRYFGEIMMPFRSAAARAMDKVSALQLRAIAPSHGPVYDEPALILEPYRSWSDGKTERKVLIVYVSMWGSTAALVGHLAEALSARQVAVALHEISQGDLGEIARDMVDARALVLGSPTVLRGLHPLALHAAQLVGALKPPAQYAALVGSYGWSGGALRQAQEILGPTGVEIVGAVDIAGPPGSEAFQEIESLAGAIAEKM